MSQSSPNPSESRSSRRRFLKTTAWAAGAAAAGGLSLARSAHAAGSDVLKVGLIGCGGRGSGAAVNALSADPAARLVAMGDLFADCVTRRLKAIREAKGQQVAVDDDHQFTGFDAYQKVIDSGVDVVILGEPPHFRPKHLKAAVDAGKHVFCEKPVAVDAPGLRSVLASVDEAQKKNLSLVSGLCWRYDLGVQETMKRVLDGAIGEIRAIQETYLTGQTGASVPRAAGMSEMEFQLRSWYFFTWLSGDYNVEQHVHSLDKALWAMGNKPPLAAWGTGGRQIPKLGDIYDHYAVVYEYPDGVHVHAYCRQQNDCYNDTSDQFIGTKGTCDVLKNRIDGPSPWRYQGPGGNMYDLEHVALFRAIREGRPINNGLYMAHSTMMAILGRMVTRTGKRITWEEAIGSQEVLAPKEYRLDGQPPTLPDAQGNYTIAAPGMTPFV